MAFNNNRARNTNAQEDNWKATAFLNFYLPSKKGPRRKLGFIALKDSKMNEAELIKFLQEDESAIQKLLNALEIDFQLAEEKPENGFALG